MKKSFFFLKGIHYRSSAVYSLLTMLKLGMGYNARFRIARRYIEPGDYVIDVCAGFGQFSKFLLEGCDYLAIEASPGFIKLLSSEKLKYKKVNLHDGLKISGLEADIVVMLISLCHFKKTSLHVLLEDFKKIGKKVVIVEDILLKERRQESFIQSVMNYLCSTDYFVPMELFTRQEFYRVMQGHGYLCQARGRRYIVGYYESQAIS